MIGITNAISSIIGRIVVSYPVGSTCTCTNGSVTYTAKDTSGACAFNIKSLGTWIVSCTNGTRTTSATVVIDAWWQTKTVNLSYTKMLILNGNQEVTFVVPSHGTLTDGSEYAAFRSGGNYAVIAYTADPVDITPYTNLTIEWADGNQSYCNKTYDFSGTCPAVGTSENAPEIDESDASLDTAYDFASLLAEQTGTFSQGAKSVDVSSLIGERYVFVTLSGSSQIAGYEGKLNIVNLYLDSGDAL